MSETLEMCHDSTHIRHDAVHLDGLYATKCERRGGLSVAQGRQWRDTSKRRRRDAYAWSFGWWIAVLCLISLASPAAAASLSFDNCLSKAILDSNPLTLQYVPLDVGVWFNLNDPLHPLNVTVYGNVSGTADQTTDYPSEDDASWNNPNVTEGKIVDLDASNYKYSTLLTNFEVLSFSPYNHPSRFCESLVQGECPLGPVFHYNL